MGDGFSVESGRGVVVELLHRVAQGRGHAGALLGHVGQVAGARGGDERTALGEALRALGKLAHPLLRLAVLRHGEVPARYVAAHRLQVLRVGLRRGPRRSGRGLLRRGLRLVGRPGLVRHLNSPGAPQGAAVHERRPVPFVLHARVDSHLPAAAAAAVGDLRDGRGVVLRVRRREPVPGGAAHHSVWLIHQVHLLLFVLVIVIEVGQLGLILIRGGVMEGGLQGGKALVYRHLLTHGVHWIFGVTTLSEAFEAFAENIPILAKKTHHPWIRHLLPARSPPAHSSGTCLCSASLRCVSSEPIILN